jgi:outer membrane immunogenic protein
MQSYRMRQVRSIEVREMPSLKSVSTPALTLALTLALTGLASNAALAADLPYADPYNGSVASTSVYDWAGFYVGAHAGYGWGSANRVDLSGFEGGVQAGFNLQSGQFVMGIEGDIGIANLDGDRGAIDVSVDSLGSVRARAGFAVNQFLIYGTGGFGFGDVEVSDSLSRDDQWNLGWVLGIGAEAALSRNWTARVEAFHYDLGSSDYLLATGNRSVSVDGNVVRVGVNYRF